MKYTLAALLLIILLQSPIPVHACYLAQSGAVLMYNLDNLEENKLFFIGWSVPWNPTSGEIETFNAQEKYAYQLYTENYTKIDFGFEGSYGCTGNSTYIRKDFYANIVAVITGISGAIGLGLFFYKRRRKSKVKSPQP